jgi:hypothetical protein
MNPKEYVPFERPAEVSQICRETGERIHDGDWFYDGERWQQITKDSTFRWFVGKEIGKPGFYFKPEGKL